MCAMMPMLRVRSSGSVRAMTRVLGALRSPAIVRERLVGLRPAVRVLALLDRLAALVRGIDDLVRELLASALSGARPGVVGEPAHRQRSRPLRTHLDGHLVGGAAHAPRLDLDARPHVLEGPAEHRQRVVPRLALDDAERSVDDPLRRALLPVPHDDAGEAPDEPVLVLRIRLDQPPRNLAASGHVAAPSARGDRGPPHSNARGRRGVTGRPAGRAKLRYFGRFAPYFDRPWWRAVTPCVSSVPRTMW